MIVSMDYHQTKIPSEKYLQTLGKNIASDLDIIGL